MSTDYRFMSTEKLIDAYVFEQNRIDDQDRKTAQFLIKKELKRRFNATLKLLDDEQGNPKGIFRYLLNV